MDKTVEYKVFISYAWTNQEHEEWVHDLATRLESNGIIVKYDKWDLEVGQDKYAFMESMVEDETIDKVLIVCDKGYKEKADSRAGGVGTETQIITPEIYDKVNQKKFIPIIAEVGEKFDSYIPIYLRGRIGIDLSSMEVFEEGYDKLLRVIAERPLYRRPIRGKLPSYLYEEEKPHFITNNLVKQINACIFKNPAQAKSLASDFISEFKSTLSSFQIEFKDFKEPYDEMIYSTITEITNLRNDYIKFLSLICNEESVFDLDIIINLFEEIYLFSEYQGNGSYNELITDHYKFFITELFLYTTAILIDKSMFKDLNLLLDSRFFVKDKFNRYDSGVGFQQFRFYIKSLDIRNSRLALHRVSLHADLIEQRSSIDNKSYKDKILAADLLLYYISRIKNPDIYNQWFPTMYIYVEGKSIELLKRLVSKRHFEKVKVLFGIETKEEMQSLIEKCKDTERGYQNSYIPGIERFIKSEEVCTFA